MRALRSTAIRSSVIAASLVMLAACADAPTSAAPVEVTAAANRTPAKGEQTIGNLAIALATNSNTSEREFTQLVAALTYVDATQGTSLVSLFRDGSDQYTVFAPTDAAFRQLYALAGTLLGIPVDDITDLPSAIVREVLLYHVTEGRRAANSVVPQNGVRTISTLMGETFAVTPGQRIRDGLTPLDPDPRPDAAIVSENVSASNGLIHIIDQVILPPSVVSTLLSLAAAR
jgi:uncharacterized surface protein with fasciclin (FAS1) repeats